MAGDSVGKVSGVLPLVSLLWTIGSAVGGGIGSGVLAYFSLREQMRGEIASSLARCKSEVLEVQRMHLAGYMPLSTYWEWKQQTGDKLNDLVRSMDRLESRLRR